MPDTVVVEGLVKHFGATRALDGISLRVRQGEVYGLLGPNGSGKTTLIGALLGMVRTDAGSVTVLDRGMPDIDVLRDIGYMTQAAALYPDLSVQENLQFFAAINGGEAHVDEALELVELADRRKSIVATLSGGMRTRLSLACAVVHRPRLLLLDEPTVGVDPRLRVQLWDKLRGMAAAGATIIVSSHVMDEAERADRLGLMLGGRILAEGTVATLKRQAKARSLEEAFLSLSEAKA